MAFTSEGQKVARAAIANSIKSFAILNDQNSELFRIPITDPRVTKTSDENGNPLSYTIIIKGTDSEVTEDIKVKGVKAYNQTSGGQVLVESIASQYITVTDGTDSNNNVDLDLEVTNA